MTQVVETEPTLIRSFDGSLIAARRLSEIEGPPILIVNAIGANLAVWRHALVDLIRERTVIAWDQRGLLASGPLASERLDPGAQAEDAAAVLNHFEAEDCLLTSWSNGSRIALEFAHRYPDRVEAWAAVCGGYGHPISRAVRRFELTSLLPIVAGVAKHFSDYLQAPFNSLVGRPEIAGLIRQSGVVGSPADTRALVDLLRGLASCDLKTLLASFEQVAGDAAPELLSAVEAPTLLIAGERDAFTPLAMVEEMQRAIPNARLEVYENATHYLPLEYPARLSHDLRRFFTL